jgi:pimeloyl-ACP methyl ester carboxylesterase
LVSCRAVRVLARRLLVGLLAAGCALPLLEHALEARDAARLTAGDTFLSVNGKRIRYRFVPSASGGPTIVLLSGMNATLEQWQRVQDGLASTAPTLTYDRAGMGFSDPVDLHDAAFEAEELDGLLRHAEFPKPVVLVSFSSSAVLARVFAARYPRSIAGLVFIDPNLPDLNFAQGPDRRGTFVRLYAKGIVIQNVKAFFGYLRLKQSIADSRDPAASPAQQKERAVLESFHHWLATGKEVFALDRSAEQAMATPDFGAIPVGVMTFIDPGKGEGYRLAFEQERAFAARSTQGTFLAAGTADHTKLIGTDVESPGVVDFIAAITARARDNVAP